jgi:hypothetical protein
MKRRMIFSSPHLIILRRDGKSQPSLYFEGKSKNRQGKAGPRITMGTLKPHHWRSPEELRRWEDQAIAKLTEAENDRSNRLTLDIPCIMSDAMSWIRSNSPAINAVQSCGNFPHDLAARVEEAILVGDVESLVLLEKMLRSQAAKVKRYLNSGAQSSTKFVDKK